jgi:hypothetical protein
MRPLARFASLGYSSHHYVTREIDKTRLRYL